MPIAIIALIGCLALSLVAFSGGLQGSVGGAMLSLLLYLAAALMVGLCEAWSSRRGVLGWLVNIVVAVIGGLLGSALGTMALEHLVLPFHPGGSLVRSQHPLLYVGLNGAMICATLGAWLALAIVNRFR